MKHFFLITLLLFCSSVIKSQVITIEYNLGYGCYSMSHLKEYIKESQKRIPLNIKTTDNFPNFLTHEVRIGYSIEKHHLGILYAFQNTVAQNHLADYSGEYKHTIKINGHKIGVFERFTLTNIKNIDLYVELAGGMIINNLNNNIVFSLEGIGKEYQKEDLNGVNYFLQPSLGMIYKLSSWLGINFNVGYEYNILNKMRLDHQETNIRSDWSGLRLNMGVITSFKIR